MNRDCIFQILNGVFQDVFDDETIIVTESTSSSDIDGWDSLIHITLIAEIEDAFHIRFPMKKVVNMKNVGEMADYIEEELG